MSVQQKIFSLPPSFTVDVKDMGLVVIETEKWTDEFVRDCMKAFLKGKLEQQRYGEGKTDAKKREDVEAQRKKFENGEFEVRIGAAATLTLAEEEFRVLLAQEFIAAKQKKSEADKMARGADREELYRDLVIKRLYAELGQEPTAEKLQEVADKKLHLLKMKAENNAARLKEMRESNDIEVEL